MVRPAPTLDRATEAELSVRQQRYRSSAAAHPIESSGMWQWSPGTPSALAIEMHAERRAACEEQLADAPDGALTLVALAPWFDASLHDDVTFS